MREENLDIRGYRKKELLASLERLFLGYHTSEMDAYLDTDDKNEMVMNYLAIKKIIEHSEAQD